MDNRALQLLRDAPISTVSPTKQFEARGLLASSRHRLALPFCRSDHLGSARDQVMARASDLILQPLAWRRNSSARCSAPLHLMLAASAPLRSS